MQYRVEGIMIRSMDYGEGNKIVTLLTKTQWQDWRHRPRRQKRREAVTAPCPVIYIRGICLFRNTGLGTLTHGEIIAFSPCFA